MVKGKKTKKTQTSKTDAKAVQVMAVDAKAVDAKAVDAKAAKAVKAVDVEAPPTMGSQFEALLVQLSAVRSQLTSVTTQVRTLAKRAEREVKLAQKNGKKKRKTGNRAPSGFVKPTKISLELAKFLGKAKGTEMARTQVTREINGYIRLHSLQDPKNGRRILADSKLKKLLKLTDKDELTYFNLQRYMSPHFAKAVKKGDVVAPVSA
jgi:chromatin remodeling complex protein RSC6